MSTGKDIVLVADYHAKNIDFRWFDEATGEERTGRYLTERAAILRQVEQAAQELSPGGQVVWIMESTTGWARVKDLISSRARFVLANVLQMPLPPKARRRKTDKIDTGRMLREYSNGSLPQSFQPTAWWRQVRRVVDCRQDLVERQTAIKNWITSLLHHETWYLRSNLWSDKGLRRLRAMAFPPSDRRLIDQKLKELELLMELQEEVEGQIKEIYDAWPEAQWVDEVRGIGVVTAVSVLAHIGPVERFRTPEELISYAGLAPGQWQSDGTSHHGRIGGGGTDGHLRYLLIEATQWLCQIPRYRPTYERVLRKRGKKIARIVVARLLLRSVHKMLRDRVRFNPAARPTSARTAMQAGDDPARAGVGEGCPAEAGAVDRRGGRMVDAGRAGAVVGRPPESDSPSARGSQDAEAVPAEPARRSRPAVGSIGEKTRTEPAPEIPRELRAKTAAIPGRSR